MRPMCAVRMGAWMVGWLVDWLVGRSFVSGRSMDREFRVGVCCMASWGVAVRFSVVYWSPDVCGRVSG